MTHQLSPAVDPAWTRPQTGGFYTYAVRPIGMVRTVSHGGETVLSFDAVVSSTGSPDRRRRCIARSRGDQLVDDVAEQLKRGAARLVVTFERTPVPAEAGTRFDVHLEIHDVLAAPGSAAQMELF